ncbi:MAG: (d)CMP kinase [Candidatus Helarchaeota archaeon]
MTTVITIGGLHGVGKTTIGKILCKYYNLNYYSAGIYFREMASKKNMTCSEFNEYAYNHPEIDHKIDEMTLNLAKKEDIVLDGAITAWIAQDLNPFKIFLMAPLDIRIKRIAERDKISFDEAMNSTISREKHEQDRFKKLYNIDINDFSIYDLAINTYTFTIDSIIKILTTAIDDYFKK